MNRTSRSLITLTIALALLSPLVGHAGSKLKHPLTEDDAINLLLETLKRDHVYDKRISLDCVTFGTDETTRTYYEIALREKHNSKCGGDPDFTPVVDRYRVNRGSGRIEFYDGATFQWRPYPGGPSGRH